jgi:hypothetical protein
MTTNFLIAIAAAVAFLVGMFVHSVYYRYASGKPLRLLVRQAVRSATDWFFEHIILIRPNRFLEYVSASGLLALLAGKIVILFAGYWYDIASTTGYIAACVAVAGFWQFHAVVKRDNEERLRAAFAALWAWSSVLVVMMYHFFHTDAATLARLILEFVVPLSVVFWFVNFVQMWVLMRYAMYPEKPREIMFFYAVLTRIESRFSDVFKMPREMQASINADVQEIAEEMQIGTRG